MSRVLVSYRRNDAESSKYSNVKEVIDFEGINMFDDVESMKRIQERINQATGG